MKTSLLSELESCMQKFLNDTCEMDGVPDGWFYDDMACDMAHAAASVYDANFKGQSFAKEQELIDS